MKRVAILSETPRPALAEALAQAGYAPEHLAYGPDLPAVLATLRPDVVFNALRSTAGRDGRVQGLFELVGQPYTHSGLLASALAGDRHQAKLMLRSAGLPVTDHVVAGRAEAARAHQLAPPYVVKPLLSGLHRPPILVRSEREPPPEALLGADWADAEGVMIERFLPGSTFDVAVMGDVALGVTELAVEDDPEAPGGKRIVLRTTPDISPNIYEKLQKMSLKAHAVFGCRGVTRMRFRVRDSRGAEGVVVCLGLDTQPDLSAAAVVPEQAREAGHSLSELVAWLVEDASCNR